MPGADVHELCCPWVGAPGGEQAILLQLGFTVTTQTTLQMWRQGTSGTVHKFIWDTLIHDFFVDVADRLRDIYKVCYPPSCTEEGSEQP